MKAFIRTLAVVYGLVAALNFWSCYGLLRLATDPNVFAVPDPSEIFGEHRFQTMALAGAAIYLVEALISLGLLYGFWTLRGWGRYLGIGYSLLWLVVSAIAFATASPPPPPAEAMTVSKVPSLVFLAGVLLRVVTLGTCLHRSARALMTR